MTRYCMAAYTESFDSLPYIDPVITQEEQDSARRLIRKEAGNTASTEHPSLKTLAPTQFSTLVQREINRVVVSHPLQGGIDLSRYEAPDEPSNDSDVATWQETLRNAYTLSTYLSSRRQNLDLLEEFGKNAWLIGNSQLEHLLKRLENELAGTKARAEEINKARKASQSGSKGELDNLQETWRQGIGKIIEVQVATEQLKEELRQRKSDAASN